jgi:hypothetical protein
MIFKLQVDNAFDKEETIHWKSWISFLLYERYGLPCITPEINHPEAFERFC